MAYGDAKVYFDGSHYIAIPKKENPCAKKNLGVWERAPKTERLHFHELFYIPEAKIGTRDMGIKIFIRQNRKRPKSFDLGRSWWAIGDSNPGPTGYEPVALTN